MPEKPEVVPVEQLPEDFFILSSQAIQECSLNLYDLFGIPDPSNIHSEHLKNHLKRNHGKLSFLDAPLYLAEANLRDLFSQFGSLRYFELMLHNDGSSKGYGMLEYDSELDLDFVFSCLSGFVLGDKALRVQRLVPGGPAVERTAIGVGNVARYAGDLRGGDIKSISARVYSNPIVAKKIEEGRLFEFDCEKNIHESWSSYSLTLPRALIDNSHSPTIFTYSPFSPQVSATAVSPRRLSSS